MRLLPCNSGQRQCKGQPAILPRSSSYPNGEPYLAGRYVDYYKCDRCKYATTLTVAEFNALPTLGVDDFKALGKQYGGNLANLWSQDLVGAGFSKTQAADLFGAGFHSPDELEMLTKQGIGP